MEATMHKEWWRAAAARDRRLDGVFVFGVLSTGIYCRPSCPARRPRKDLVVFFRTPEEARRAGFRPCLRCHPDETVVKDPRVEMVKSLCRFIDEYDDSDRPLTLAVMGEQMGISPSHLGRTFRGVMGISPRQYAEVVRDRRLKRLVRSGSSVTDALYAAGYGSTSRHYAGAPERLGMTPGAYGRGGRGMRIRYEITDSPLGRLLVAATERGVSAVSIGESDEGLEKRLFTEYPAAEIVRDGEGLDDYIGAILAYLDGGGAALDLPTDVIVTAFQARVYEALRRIPRGQTKSYAEIAEAIGKPHAARAVGRACAKNPTALVVPCHRVTESGGDLGGYRWGAERKKALLAREKESELGETFEAGAGI
jgi:AraC family transcriptional regulator of adaptative response/methylated-DNA-[protein]-cysteine methyltransferase